jgi:hypothetical protein
MPRDPRGTERDCGLSLTPCPRRTEQRAGEALSFSLKGVAL